MTEAVRRESGMFRLPSSFSAWRGLVARVLSADLLTVLIAILLPWSTSGVAIMAGLWLIGMLAIVDPLAFVQSLKRPISVLPIALFLLAVAGTLWSDAPWGARLYSVGPAVKLLVLPILFYQFERSNRGMQVFIGFLASCTVLMAVSWLVALDPSLSLKPDNSERGIFVKNYIDQGQEFTLCAVALAYPIATLLRTNRIWTAALLAAVALSLVVNMVFVIVSRTAMVTMPIMLAAFAVLHLKWRTNLMLLCAGVVLVALAWAASPQLRTTVTTFQSDYQRYKERNVATSIGLRLEFWRKSLGFFAEAPVAGHGTGSTLGLFEQAAIGPVKSAGGQVIGNPHNQTLNVAVQWGTIGIIVLYAMWLVHLQLFRGAGLVNWIGLLVVVQNIFTSLFNSHLFDFHEGWMYVLGVGVAGGMTLAAKREEAAGLSSVPVG
jgi:O-antigen ligase